MVYMGSKNRIAKELIPIITKYLTEERWYVEPFCGGCNMIDKINHPHRMANDKQNYLIAMWRFLVDGIDCVFPKEIDKELYSYYRNIYNKRGFKGDATTDTEAKIGWVGFMGSCKGRFFDGGYCGGRQDRNFIKEHINNIISQKEYLKGVKFSCGSYSEMNIPSNSIVYCDIPYKSTKQYSISKDFNHDAFWEWCRDVTKKGNDVLISEYQAPKDFVCVWSKQVNNALNNSSTIKSIEKLFVHESIAYKYKDSNLF